MRRALIIIAHGSSVNPDTARTVSEHASALARRPVVADRFDDVVAVFLKQAPFLAELRWRWDEAVIVPFFMADGYFVRRVLPRELDVEPYDELPAVRRIDGCRVTVLPPLGLRLELLEVVRARIDAHAPDAHVLIVGHGTPEHAASTSSVLDVADALRDIHPSSVRVGFVDDDPPLSESWADDVHDGESVVVVPYFAFAGPHVLDDIPSLLGLPNPELGPHHVAGRTVWYAEPVGVSDRIPAVLERMVDDV